MAPGARRKFGTPIFEPEDLRKQMYCIEEGTCDIVGIFWRPRNHSGPPQSFRAPRVIRRPGNCAPLPFHYAPADWTIISAGLTIRQTRHARHVSWGHEKIQATCVRKTLNMSYGKLKIFFWWTYCCEINLQYLLFRGVHDCFPLQ